MRTRRAAGSLVWAFVLAALKPLEAAPTHLVQEPLITHKTLDDGTILLDFGKVACGNLKVNVPVSAGGRYEFHFGESMANGRINRKPPGSVRYGVGAVHWAGGEEMIVAPPVDGRNTTHPSAVRLPADWGVITPFRWIEIEGWKGDFNPDWIVRQSAQLKAWDDNAAAFQCSDELLNKIWDLCKYSIKATTFAGVYVDGDRERIPEGRGDGGRIRPDRGACGRCRGGFLG